MLFRSVVTTYILVVFFIALLISHLNDWENKISLAQSYVFKVSGVLMLIVRHIFFMPIMLVLFSSMKCEKINISNHIIEPEYDCFSVTHIILFTTAILAALMFTIVNFLSIIFFSDENPDSKLPWGYYNKTVEAFKLFREFLIAISIYFAKDNVKLGMITIAIVFFVYIYSLYLLFKQLYMKSKGILCLIISIENSLSWSIDRKSVV